LSKDTIVQSVVQKDYKPSARWRHTLIRVNNALALVGGVGLGGVALSDIWLFHPQTCTWRRCAFKLPFEGLHSHATSVANSLLLISGGIDTNGRVRNEIIIIDISREIIKLVERPGLLPRFSHESLYICRHLYFIGGVSDKEEEPGLTVLAVNTCEDLLPPSAISAEALEFPLNVPVSCANYCFSSHVQGEIVSLIGGGGNCFSFGSHIASTITQIVLSKEVNE